MTSPTQYENITLESTLEDEVVDHPLPMTKEVEPEMNQEEIIISLHALSGISAP